MKFIRYFISLCMSARLAESKGFWSNSSASVDDIIRQAYPLGNGRLGGHTLLLSATSIKAFANTEPAMPFGPAGSEQVVLNIDSLWSGGPFQNASYTGGNPSSDKSQFLPGIREEIFKNGVGNVDALLGTGDNYGSFQVYAYLTVNLDGISAASGYNRSLDFDTGIHTTTYAGNDANTYTSNIYCSYPDQICVYSLSSTGVLPEVSIKLENSLLDTSLFNVKCEGQFTRLSGRTHGGSSIGMKFDGIARLTTPTNISHCDGTEAAGLIIPAEAKIQTFTIVFGAGTDYDQKAGNAASNYSFKGVDPASFVESVTEKASFKTEAHIRETHVADYQSLMSQFTLDLPDSNESRGRQTSDIIASYDAWNEGDPYIESTLFAYGRHLLVSSQRENSLPSNLAGVWSETLVAAWSADYHANINTQMNHWGMEQTGLGKVFVATSKYLQDTWAPRGSKTAELLYGAPGWVTHNEMNIFGHTGMKNDAQWANYPISAAWMMQHVYDHYSYSQDISWYKQEGYPLMKGVAQFWLSQLKSDDYFSDDSLVVNPCNSAEHGPTTFGCTHYQQLIYQLFTDILSSVNSIPDLEPDTQFISNITTSLQSLDKGLHIGTWGEIKEWKLPDSLGYDVEGDTHRHLSQLVGWYPGYSVSAYQSGYSNATIQAAVAKSLQSRGIGSGPDGDAGWEKVWRSACWAHLNNNTNAYFHLKYAIDVNFVGNGLSMYSKTEPPFQIDANYGLVGAVMAMLIRDLPNVSDVVLGPAIPRLWSGGNVKGLRLRGGGAVSFTWDSNGVVQSAQVSGRTSKLRLLNKDGLILQDFEAI